MRLYLYLFFCLEDRPVLFILLQWSSSCHQEVVCSSGKGSYQPSTMPIAPGPPHKDCLPCMCSVARQEGMRGRGEWSRSGERFHHGAPCCDSDSNAKSEEKRAPVKRSQTLTRGQEKEHS